MARSVLLINGPNLNLLGTREPGVYGASSLAEVEQELMALAARHRLVLACFQSNHEGALIDRVQAAKGEGVDFLIINAGALTHTSIGLRDALAAVMIPFIEVHVSNLHRREQFRQVSMLADLALGSIIGLGTAGYRLALDFALTYRA